jgi:hypothetical protein
MSETDTKAWKTLRARLALAGFIVDMAHGSCQIVVSRWAFSRRFDNVAEAERWAAKVLGAAGADLKPAAQDVRPIEEGCHVGCNEGGGVGG